MQLNVAIDYRTFTHGGAPAVPHLTPLQQLRRTVSACLLWESGFYEDGQTVAERIASLCAKVRPEDIAALAVECRTRHHLRHAPLLLTAELAKRGGPLVSQTLAQVIQRADELPEFLSIYWRNGKTPIAKQVKKGLAEAFKRFTPYQLAKYNRDRAIKLRDVLFLTHPKPKDDAQAAAWKQLVDGTLSAPDTWEVALSGGADKRDTFERMLREGTLGYLALLRNLRNMAEAGVDRGRVQAALEARKGADKVLPFRYVAAARAVPQWEAMIDAQLCKAVESLPELPGQTVVLVDVSGSMDAPLSQKSDLRRIDAAAALASIIRGDLRVVTFSSALVEVPARRGMSGVDTIIRSQAHSSTELAAAVKAVNERIPHDRLIVITDEQATGFRRVPDPVAKRAYMINVATDKNGVGYGKWTHIDGFSESVLRFIAESEFSTVN